MTPLNSILGVLDLQDKEKANEVAAAVHKQLDEDDEKKTVTAHVEVQDTKNATYRKKVPQECGPQFQGRRSR
jgi:hypothetical protein